MHVHSVDLAHVEPFRIGPVMVVPAHRLVSRDDVEEIVEPRVLQVLVALAKAKGEVLSRDDLIASCWGGRIVGDNAIHRAVSRVRDLAKGVGGDAFEVVTVKGVGYRLLSGDAEHRAIDGPAFQQRPNSDGQSWPRRSVLAVAGAGVATAALIGFGPWPLPRKADSETHGLFERAEAALRDEEGEYTSQQAASLYHAALERSPRMADAWGGLALAYCQMLENVDDERTADIAKLSASAAARALSIDADNGRALVAKLMIPPAFGRWGEALSRLDDLSRRVDRWEILAQSSRISGDMGEVGTALVRSQRAIDREPLLARLYGDQFYQYWIAGRIHEAEEVLAEGSRRWPRYYYLWASQFLYLATVGRHDLAASHLQRTDNRPNNLSRDAISSRQRFLSVLDGSSPENRSSLVRRYVDDARSSTWAIRNSALMLGLLGENDLVLQMLHGFFRGEGPFARRLVTFSRRPTAWLYTPMLDRLRDDARFGALMASFGLPVSARR